MARVINKYDVMVVSDRRVIRWSFPETINVYGMSDKESNSLCMDISDVQ